jgi:putative membrane protein
MSYSLNRSNKKAMRIKTMFLIVATILLTIIITQNSADVTFNILFWHPVISRLVVMAVMTIAGFIIGYMIGRPRTIRIDESHPSLNNPTGTPPDTLSDEDREYIK